MRYRFLTLFLGLAVAAGGPACDARSHLVGETPLPGTVAPGGGNPAGTNPQPPPMTGPPGPTPGAPPPAQTGATPRGSCSFGSAAMPVRPLDPALAPATLADRLARLFWSGAADEALVRRAAAATTSQDVGTIAVVMMADRRFAGGLATFYGRWLGLDDATGILPVYREETRRFVIDVIRDGDARLETLLTAPYSFLNAENGPAYGLSLAGSELRKIALDPAQRGGVLTQPARLARDEVAPKRGRFVQQQLLCQPMPEPPASLPSPSPLAGGGSYREQHERQLGQNAVCGACHHLLDPPGFAFEHFGRGGEFRQLDGGKPIDASGGVELDGKQVTFAGFRDAITALATSCAVPLCLTRQMLAHASDRDETADVFVREVAAAFAASSFDLRQLMVAVAQSPAFLAP